MRLRLPPDQVAALRVALARAGTSEIGGQIFGEQLAPSDFVASEMTFQKKKGSFARFVVDLVQAAKDALRFFERTSHRYSRFNYIGEWHSHPSFAVRPSEVDLASMRRLVEDPGFSGSFAILLIVRLAGDELLCGGWLFDPQGRSFSIDLEFADDVL